jgi:hypothetical protein
MPAKTMTSVATIRRPVIATASVEPAGASAPDAAFATSSARSAACCRLSRSRVARRRDGASPHAPRQRTVARRTLVWRANRALVVRESENADHLDLLGSSCLILARVAPSLTPTERPSVRDLSEVIAALARELGAQREDRVRGQLVVVLLERPGGQRQPAGKPSRARPQ